MKVLIFTKYVLEVIYIMLFRYKVLIFDETNHQKILCKYSHLPKTKIKLQFGIHIGFVNIIPH